MKKDLLSLDDLTLEEMLRLFKVTDELKAKVRDVSHALAAKCLGLIFLKPSLRTRVSFEAAMAHLGGAAFYLPPEDIKFGTRESVKDIGHVLSRYLDAIVIRTFSQKQVEELAVNTTIPVINGLTDLCHPCQALSDLYTIKEKKGTLKNLRLVFVGDGNNIVHSLLHGCAKIGVDFTVATPEKYKPQAAIVKEALEMAKVSGAKISLTDDPLAAARGADVLYTDVWTSMGRETEREERRKSFQGFQINDKLVSLAKPDCLVMHCLPAHRGEEITDEVIDGPHSVVFDQAENRMHVQKAILLF
ncbi:MAG: ornithine carbamoyltransferase, partial [Candidatus Omnitrophota bacterium]